MVRGFIAKFWFIFSFCSPLYLGAQFPQGFTHETIIEGRQQINGVTFDANGRLYFWEKHGAVFIVEDGQMLTTPLLDIRNEVANWRDHGLLGFALDPGFLNNGYIYALYVVDRYALFHLDDPDYDPHFSEEFAATIGRVTRFTADPATNFTTLIPNSRKVLLGETPQTGIPILHESHGVGSLVFGTDGTLLISAGDAASYLGIDTGGEEGGAYITQALADGIIRPKEDVGAFRAQLIDCHNGKLLRIDPQTGDGLPSNPFYDSDAPRAPRSRVWTLGLRNPFRFALLPETGSHDPADGDPGVFMVGDVGFTRWEELTRIGQGGLNGGWPYYEGLRHHPYFWGKRTFNLDAPNPWYDGGDCDEPFLAFQDLMQQPNAQGNYQYAHSCRPGVPLPDSLPTFVHHPPEMDWGNQYLEPEVVRTTRFNAQGQLELVRISETDAPIRGEEFNGFSITGGVVYDQENWPEEYRGKYLMADYNAKWFKSVTLDSTQEVEAIDHFGKAPYFVTGLAVSPSDGCLYYAAYAPRVCRICYGGNVAPQARIQADTLYGPSPLRVSFSADSSFDPNGDPLTFQWDLGDGIWVNGSEISHLFESAGSDPEAFTVTLRAIDTEGAVGQSSQIISLNNTPPQVNINSIEEGYRYPLDDVSVLELDALVIDQEHTEQDLSYQWQTILHHNDHTHPEGLDSRSQTAVRITPVGCGTEQYYYRIRLEVTDAHGLTGVDERYLYPDCPEFIRWGELFAQSSQAGVSLLWETELEINTRRFEVQRSVDGGGIWLSVGYVEAADFSVLPISYSWQDRAPYAGEARYRLRLIEASGQASLSSEVMVNWDAPQNMSLYPNPLKDEATVVLGAIAGEAVLNISDLSGRSLYRQGWDEGEHFAQSIDLGFLPIGVYIYTIKNGERQIQGKLIKE